MPGVLTSRELDALVFRPDRQATMRRQTPSVAADLLLSENVASLPFVNDFPTIRQNRLQHFEQRLGAQHPSLVGVLLE